MISPRKRKTQVSASERISMCAEHSWDCVAGQRPARWKNCRSEFLLATMCQAGVPRAPGSRGKTCGSRGSCSVWSAATLSQTMLSRFEHEVCVHSKKFAPALVSQRFSQTFWVRCRVLLGTELAGRRSLSLLSAWIHKVGTIF